MESSNYIISTISENNIFHIFAFDIVKRYKPDIDTIYICSEKLDLNNVCQQWRFFVLLKLYPTAKISLVNSPISPTPETHGGFFQGHFEYYNPDNYFIELVDKINSKLEGEYILINQRSVNHRYAYDYETKLPLQEYLLTKEFKYPIKSCNFETMTAQEQYEICSKAKIFICVHGAGCMNLIFTPQNCPMIEINFRKNWYCDPVCDDHFSGKISINDNCNGNLNYGKGFHKADFHNFCRLIDKKYTEMEAVCYAGKFIDRNPISKEQIYIDGHNLTKVIETYL